MDGFSYYNIFDTKGIEYLVIIAFLLLLIPFWFFLNKESRIKRTISNAIGVLTASILRIPQGIFYSKNHTWAFLEKSGKVRIGLDDLLLHITGGVNVNYLKSRGESIRKGDTIARIEQDGKTLSISSPVSGKVVNANPELKQDQSLLNSDPYGKGWIYMIEPSNWVQEIPSFYMASDATNWFNKELDRYKDFLSVKMPVYSKGVPLAVLQDGGELMDNSLSGMPAELWNDFQKEFLEFRHSD